MKWPFVTRSHLEAVERANATTMDYWKSRAIRLEAERDHYEKAFLRGMDRESIWADKWMALAFPPVVVPPDIPRQPSVPSVVAQTIKDESGGDPRLAAWFRKRASELRAEGKSPEEIAAQLGTWQSTEEETAA